jgi:predicted ATPase
MKISNLKIKVTGLFGKYDYDLDLSKKINILIGENGDGKSSIINIINSIFNHDYFSLTKIKFSLIELTYNNKTIKINYNDLFADISTYFDEYSFFEEEIYRHNIDLIRMFSYRDDFENTNIKNSFIKIDYSLPDYVKNFKVKGKSPDSVKTKLILDLLNNFSLSDLNGYISLVINYKDEVLSKIFDQLILEENSIFNYIHKHFNKRKVVSFTLSDFNDFIVKINKKLTRDGYKEINIIQNSRYLMSGNYFNDFEQLSEYDNKNFLKLQKAFNVKKLNMVELFDIDSKIKPKFERLDRELERKSTNRNFKENQESESNTTTSINMSIKRMFKQDGLLNFSRKFLELSSEKIKLNSIESIKASKEVEKIGYENLQGQLKEKYTEEIRRFVISSQYQGRNNDDSDKLSTRSIYSLNSRIRQFYELSKEEFNKSREFIFEETAYKALKLNELLDELWKQKDDNVKKTEIILSDFFVSKKISILSAKRFLISDVKTKKIIPLEFLSSGEKKILTIISSVILGDQDDVILIDEPELSLSIPWQEKLIDSIEEFGGKILIATQSNHIALDKHFGYVVPMIGKEYKL